MSNARLAILASGNGTTAEAFIRARQAGQIDVAIELVICNNSTAGIFERIDQLNREFGLRIKAKHISHLTHPTDGKATPRGEQTPAEEAAILDMLKAGEYDAVVLMGYMKRIGKKLVREFGWHSHYKSPYQASMLNTHPGLLPATRGLYGLPAQEFVLSQGHTEAGQTLHIVAEKYDEGPILAEHKVPVKPNDTPELLFARVQEVEKRYLPPDVAEFIQKRRQYQERKK